MFHKATFDDAAGKLAGMIGTILDITTRKQAEKALAECEARYRAVVSALGEGIVLIALDAITPAIEHPNVTASIGVALFPDDATEPSILLRQADAAMYRVKSKGKNAVAFYATS